MAQRGLRPVGWGACLSADAGEGVPTEACRPGQPACCDPQRHGARLMRRPIARCTETGRRGGAVLSSK
jgi:hypothetical protein